MTHIWLCQHALKLLLCCQHAVKLLFCCDQMYACQEPAVLG